MKNSSTIILAAITFLLCFILQSNIFSTPKAISQDLPPELQDREQLINDYEARYIPGASMLPTIESNDHVLVDKHTYRTELPKRGDIVIFNAPEILKKEGFKGAFIHRAIGLPGETIEIKSGQVYINDSPLQEDYILEPAEYEVKRTKIPVNSYFVLGDYRNNAYDSHFWGFLPQTLIFGKAIGIFCPVERQKVLTTSQPLSSKNQAVLTTMQKLFQDNPDLCKKATSQDLPPELQNTEGFINDYEARYITTYSMLPTLEGNDRVLVDKHTY